MTPTTISVNDQDFRVLKLIGKGKGGYSYLVTDGEERYIIKQIHHEPCAYYQFGDKLDAELNDYQRLSQIGIPMPKMIDVDITNERILKEFIDGQTAFDMVLNDELPYFCIDQIRAMVTRLYSNNLNIDYFPTNFVLQNDTLYYIDYECNAYSAEWNFENWGIKYWSKTAEFIQYVEEHNI